MIRHVAGVGEIVESVEDAARFYREVLGLEVEHEPGSQYATVSLPGILHYGIWDRRAAAEATFGDPDAADRVPLGLTLGFEVDDVEAAAAALVERGWRVELPPKREPWGQVVCRFFLPSGMLAEVAETPWARRVTAGLEAAREE